MGSGGGKNVVHPERAEASESGPTCEFEVVATSEQQKHISKIKGNVRIVEASGSSQNTHERLLRITCASSLVSEVIKCVQLPIWTKQQPAASVAAPAAAEPEASTAPPEPSVPSSTIDVATKITLGATWDGRVPLKFHWDPTPDVFSEFSDPTGSNWSSTAPVRRAHPDAPRQVVLQYRQGMTGTWTDVTCRNGVADLVIQPPVVEGQAFRGFQSRWVVDGEKYLTPLERAPTLSSKLLSYPTIRNLVKNLPPDKQKIENIPNDDVRKALAAVENIVPMNTWDYAYDVRGRPGAIINGSIALTMTEKIQLAAQGKLNDPQVQAELRGTVMKSPIMVVGAALGTVGISLDAIVSNLDFFIPKPAEPDFSLLQKIGADATFQEQTRREMQTDLNKLFPNFQNGIRVVLPTSDSIQRAMSAKRPTVAAIALPVLVEFVYEKDYFVQHQVQFVFWSGENSQQIVVNCLAVEESESAGLFSSEKKSAWKKYTGQLSALPGVYRYHWVADGAAFFSGGRPYTGSIQPPSSYEEFVVESQVMFGIGVVM